VCNLHIETHFFIFSSFTFLTEKTTKNRCKTASGKKCRKTRPEDPPGPRFGTQNGPELTLRFQKASQKRKKRDFWPLRERSQKKVKKKPLSLKVPQLAGVEPKLKIYVSV
jgi:hypothetical protein